MVLDASGAVELLLHTASGKRLAARLADESEVVHVPHLIDVEIAHVLRRYAARGMLSERAAALALHRWRSFDVERYPHEPFLDRIWQFRANFSAYDAVYLALAEMLPAVLVTGDRRLAVAPGAKVTVELIQAWSGRESFRRSPPATPAPLVSRVASGGHRPVPASIAPAPFSEFAG